MKYSYLTKIVKIFFLSNKSTKKAEFGENIFDSSIKFQNLYLTTTDNVKIGAWLLEPREEISTDRKFAILLHGTGSNRADFCKSFLIQKVVQRNYCILIPDYRDFGDSEGIFSIDGVNHDIDACMEYMMKKSNGKIHLIGHSFGAAVTLEYSRYIKNDDSENALDKKKFLGKIVLISPFSSSLDILNDFSSWKVLKRLYPSASDIIKKEFNYNSIENIKTVDKNNIFILHGTNDSLIKESHSIKLKNVIDCELYLSKDDDHFKIMYNFECWNRINLFLKK